MAAWEAVTLGSLIEIVHGFAFKGEHFADTGEQIVLTPGNFRREGGLVVRPEKERYYTSTYPSEFLLGAGDLLVAMTDLTQGAPLLGAPLVVPPEGTFLHNQRLGKVLIRDPSRLDARFAFYVFCDETVRASIRASATGATVRHTAPSRICAIAFDLPPLDTQRRIGAVLAAYDELIENNTKRIRALEEMARALWSHWLLSVGSMFRPLGELISLVRDQADPRRLEAGTRYIGLEHMPRRSLCLADSGHAGDVVSAKTTFRQGDILFGKIRPYFHKVGIAFFDGITSNDAIVMRVVDPEHLAAVLMCVSSDAFVADISQKANGSKMPRANWSDMERYRVATGDAAQCRELNERVVPMVGLMRALTMRSRALREARDLLLPKLLSGELAADRVALP